MRTEEREPMRWGEAVIFAGGRSSRMGQDKALLPFGDHTTLAQYQYQRLLPFFTRVSLSTKTDKFPFDASLIFDQNSESSSPMIALASVLRAMEGDTVFVLSVDMPFVDAQLIGKLQDAIEEHPRAQIAVPRSSRGVEPLCAVYRRTLLPTVEQLLTEGEHRMRALFQHVDLVEVFCPRDAVFANLNTPQEYRHYKEQA